MLLNNANNARRAFGEASAVYEGHTFVDGVLGRTQPLNWDTALMGHCPDGTLP